MGATLIAALITGSEAITAEVGDSRCYVLRNMTLTLLSRDQTHVQILLEQGLMTKEMIKSSKAKNVVLQSCGNAPELVVAQRVLSLRDGDRLLLCSDGLTLHVDDDEIGAVLGTCATLEGACARLLALVKERGGRDNVTIVAAQVGGSLLHADPSENVADTVQTIREFRPGE
jgi:PPM family protein phosphatase